MNKLKIIVPGLVLLTFLVLPVVVLGVTEPGIADKGLSLSEIEDLIDTVANFIITIGIIIVVIAIVWAGIQFATAGGDTTKQENAKMWLKNGLIAAVIVLGVGVLLNTASNMVTRSFFR